MAATGIHAYANCDDAFVVWRYDERIPDDVRKSSNYFYDELVRILADGDASALGL